MTVRFEHDEIDALLTDLAAATEREPEDVLLDLLRNERARLDGRARRIAEGLWIDEEFRRRLERAARRRPALTGRNPRL